MILSHFVGLSLLNLPHADEDDTVSSREYRPFQGKYVGHTSHVVKEAVQDAMGGCLFIDEAYALSSGDGDAFSGEAVLGDRIIDCDTGSNATASVVLTHAKVLGVSGDVKQRMAAAKALGKLQLGEHAADAVRALAKSTLG